MGHRCGYVRMIRVRSRGQTLRFAVQLFVVVFFVMAALPSQAATVFIDINSTAAFGTKTIDFGDTVVWTNFSGMTHNVTANGDVTGERFASDVFDRGVFEVTFDEMRDSDTSYGYRCTIHPSVMIGRSSFDQRPRRSNFRRLNEGCPRQ